MSPPRRGQPASGGEALRIDTGAGTVGGRLRGAGPALAICLPGIATNHRCFDALAGALAAAGRVAAIDFRGRGDSPATEAGSYGWDAHARDVLAVAGALGDGPLDLVGHSMGAFVAMRAAVLAPGRIRSIVLIDALGPPEGAALRSMTRVARAVGRRFSSGDAYVAAMRAHEVIEPWSDSWDRALRHELVPAHPPRRGMRLRTSRRAVMEDALHAATRDPRRMWPYLTMPVLLVRATVPLRPEGGLVVAAADRERLAAAAPRLEVVEVPANHYGVVAHELTVRSVTRFLRREAPEEAVSGVAGGA